MKLRDRHVSVQRHLHDRPGPAPAPTLSRAATLILAVASGAIAANLYYAQPLLQLIARALGVSSGSVGLVVTVTQIGFALGLVFVLPVGDLIDRRRLLSALLLLDAVGLLVVAASGGLTLTLIGFGIVGLANVAAQVIVPVAASLASDADRGKVVGTVISGLLVGMLLARSVAGLVSEFVSWRVLFYAAALLMIILIAVTRATLPPTSPQPGTAKPRYTAVLRSTVTLYRQERTLRVRSWFGALGFAAFSLFWSTAAFLLGGGIYHYPPVVIGLFGLLGAAGALVANLTGRIRSHTHPVPTAIAVLVLGVSFVVLMAAPHTLIALVVGILTMDVGVQALHVLNQRTIFDLDPAARARANSVYMTFYFFGGAIGSAVGVLAWQHAGWTGVCTTGVVIAALAALVWISTVFRTPVAAQQTAAQQTPAQQTAAEYPAMPVRTSQQGAPASAAPARPTASA